MIKPKRKLGDKIKIKLREIKWAGGFVWTDLAQDTEK
jgi:hypothetical protein